MNRSVVVTGSSHGIGRAIAERLSADGWFVVGVGRRRSEGPFRAFIEGDAAEHDTHQRAAAAAVDLAPLRGWVNNAGLTRRTPLHELDIDAVRAIVDVNGLGYIWGCSTAVRSFIDSGEPGAIVNIGSIHGRRAFVDHAAYEFTKGGIDALTRSVAVSYGPYGIRANAIAPAGVMTPHLENQIRTASDPEAEECGLREGPPAKRISEAVEVASLTSFLLGSSTPTLTGQSIALDGGWSASFGIINADPGISARFGGVND